MNKVKLYLAIAIVIFCSASLYAEGSWSNWRGPQFTGVAPDCNPPTVWSETQNIKWKVKLTGDGSDGSPIVWKDKIFFQTAVKTDKVVTPQKPEQTPPVPAAQTPPPAAAPEKVSPPAQGGQIPVAHDDDDDDHDQTPPPAGQPGQTPPPPGRPQGHGGMDIKTPTNIYQFNLVCMDRNTGKILWEKTACEALPHQGVHPDHGFASFTPVTDGKYIWANFGSRGLYCYDFDGKLVWKKDLVNMKNKFGEAGSLALAGDAVIVVADNDTESWIFAFNKTTGDLLWKKQRDEKTSYGTPVVVKVNDQLQVVTVATNKTRSYNPKTGDILWECGSLLDNVIPTAVAGFNMLFCASGSRGSGILRAVKLNHTGVLTDADAFAWQTKDIIPHIPSPLLYGRRLYVYMGNPLRLSCYDAQTGKVLYDKQPFTQMKDAYASPIGAADKVYCVGREGTTCILKNADTFEIIATNKLDDAIDCTPAIVDNEIILKGKQFIYCIAEKT
jgi:outer membrane protein assembly factor BamB